MIGALDGKIHTVYPDRVLVLVQGVGYLVFVPQRLVSTFKKNAEIFLHIHTHVREDALSLFGFTKEKELELFELLLSVSGVGPKTALSILGQEVDAIKQAVIAADVDFFTAIPRLGKKNAQKIIIELKPKLGGLADIDLTDNNSQDTREVVEALTGMGFTRIEVTQILKHVPQDIVTIEEKIKAALKFLGKNYDH